MTTRTTSPSPASPVKPAPDRQVPEDEPTLLVDELGRPDAKTPAKQIRTIVAMPAYNEEKYIAKTIVGAQKSADRVLVVDDGSKDDTVVIARALGALVVQHETNKGYGGALQTIFATAREVGAEELVIIDSDGQHNPQEIPHLLAELRKGPDVVIGSRFVDGNGDGTPADRKAGISVPGRATTMAGTDRAISDFQDGFGAYGKRAIEAIRPGGNGISASSEILLQINDHHLQVAAVPLGVYPDTAGASSTSAVMHGEPCYRGKQIAVVIPAYNEEDLIRETLDGIPGYVARIYAVNDGSADRTGAIIDAYAERDPRIIPIHHNPNRGVGAAITSGYKRAIADGMDVAAVMAGDNQMDPTHLPSLLDPIIDGRADYTKGNRLINEAYREGMPPWRSFGNSLLTFLTKVASGYWQMMDPQNGYTAISVKALAELPLESVYQGYGYCNNLLVWLNIHNMTVRDVAIPARYGREKSKIRYSTYIPRVSKLLLGNFLFRLKTKYIQMGFHPLAFFYLAGAVLAPIGVVGGLITLWEKFVMGYPVLFVHGVLSFLMLMLGMQFLFFAMFFDMQAEKNSAGTN
ncbi:glycosyltransferase family 2 protein [Methanoculleus sp. FWC-SCC1]|uniref:Glycosyltransferase family 2 protein n=1 Tax=Methanoculleus frigidifontis TaxID=2584085 RepID=A0ABT8MCR7_9EURY|nr:glycosyltransferase family 2 protein [Methanoculleus sp. FWC-SCC1]MDN7025670.1 glycosyltransferase family 2 protein [Methanoculleus sp. FWC-SCC1]